MKIMTHTDFNINGSFRAGIQTLLNPGGLVDQLMAYGAVSMLEIIEKRYILKAN